MEHEAKSSFSFPLDVTSEILSRLPEKSVARFRCLSKLWSSITTDPYFINLLETRSLRQPNLLLCLKKKDNLFVSSIPLHTQISNRSYSFSKPIDLYHMKVRPGEYGYFAPQESVHGLIFCLESHNPIVLNPSTRQFLTLPKPGPKGNIILFLGYDPVQGNHKVVCIPYKKTCYVGRVLTLGSAQDQESWRTVRTNHRHRSCMDTSGRCIKGVIYYLACHYKTRDLVLMSFDVRSEKFDMIGLPFDIHCDTLMNYGGRLACVDYGKRLWILEDAEKHKWSTPDFLVPNAHYDKTLRTRFELRGFTHAGEFIYAPDKFHKSFYIFFFDPMRNSYRRFEFEGITYDETWLNNGDRNDMLLHVYPNHIESQMSL